MYQAHTEVLEIANEAMTYKSVGLGGEELTVHLDLEEVSVRILDGEKVLFQYSA
ncbi:hypothetical protein D3C83_143550 [compost metagenome]